MIQLSKSKFIHLFIKYLKKEGIYKRYIYYLKKRKNNINVLFLKIMLYNYEKVIHHNVNGCYIINNSFNIWKTVEGHYYWNNYEKKFIKNILKKIKA